MYANECDLSLRCYPFSLRLDPRFHPDLGKRRQTERITSVGEGTRMEIGVFFCFRSFLFPFSFFGPRSVVGVSLEDPQNLQGGRGVQLGRRYSPFLRRRNKSANISDIVHGALHPHVELIGPSTGFISRNADVAGLLCSGQGCSRRRRRRRPKCLFAPLHFRPRKCRSGRSFFFFSFSAAWSSLTQVI